MRAFILFLLTLSMVLLPDPSFAKESKDLMKANYYYSHNAYTTAIPYFEKLSEAEKPEPGIFGKLGDCYRLTGNPEKAAIAYEKATADSNCSNTTYLNYGLVLMKLSRYDDAEKKFRKYSDQNSADTRIGNLIASCSVAANRVKNELPEGVAMFAPFNSDGIEFAPTFWNGKLVFTSDTALGIRKGTDKWSGNAYFGIYSIPCAAPGEYGTEVTKIAASKDLDIKYHTGPCTFGAKGKEMYYTRSKYNNAFLAQKAVSAKDSTVLLEIMIASDYDEKGNKFRTITPFQHNSDKYSVGHPAISPDGSLLVFSSDMPGGAGNRDLYFCKKTGKNNWTRPVRLGAAINTGGDDSFPFWADDSTLLFSSDGHIGLGGLDVYKTTYSRDADTFYQPENMPIPLNSSYDDISLALPAGAGSGYFSSDRPAEKGGDNIYFYKRARIFLNVTLKDSTTGRPVAGAKISVRSADETKEVTTTGNGNYFARLYPRTERYTITINHDEYPTRNLVIQATISTSSKEVDTIARTITLSKHYIPHDTIVDVVPVVPDPYLRQGIMDSAGIPVFEVDKVYVIGYFDFNFNKFYYKTRHADVDVDKRVVLDTLYNILQRHPTMRIQVQAHSDCRGTDAYNMKLSIERAYSVVEYLLEKGIADERLQYRGFGETQPVIVCPDCLNCSEEQHAQNRVLEFRVLQL